MGGFQLSWPQLNPIIVREVRTRMRGARPYIILTFFLIALVLAGAGIYFMMLQQRRFGATVLSPQVGQALFYGLTLCELFMVVLLAPAMTSGAVSGEREQLTYEMLVATPLPPGRILWGKLVGALSYLLLLLFASLPIFSVVLIFGGVEPSALAKVLLLLLLTTLVCGMVGLFCSSLLGRTVQATVVSYVLIIVVLGATSVLGQVWGQFSNPIGSQAPPPVLYLNPFSALNSITVVAPRTDGTIFIGDGNPLGWLPLVSAFGPSALYYGPQGPVVIPTYRATYLVYVALVLLMAWVSAHTVLPRRRWLPRGFDAGFALMWLALVAAAWLTRSWWYIPAPTFG